MRATSRRASTPRAIAWIGTTLSSYAINSWLLRSRSTASRCFRAFSSTRSRVSLLRSLRAMRPRATAWIFTAASSRWISSRICRSDCCT
jgi:hypothetical protein